jgi:hypothetical protein
MTIDIANPGVDAAALKAALSDLLPNRLMMADRVYPVVSAPHAAFDLDGWQNYSLMLPVYLPNPQEFDQILIGVFTVTGATGGAHNSKIAIYTDVDGLPAARIGAEEIVPLAVGNDQFAAGSFVFTEPGWYWVAMVMDAPVGVAATVKGVAGSATEILPSAMLLGYPDTFAVVQNKTPTSMTIGTTYDEGWPAVIDAAYIFSVGGVLINVSDAGEASAPMFYMQPIPA